MGSELLWESIENRKGLVVTDVGAAVSLNEGRIIGGTREAVGVGQDETVNAFTLADIDWDRLCGSRETHATVVTIQPHTSANFFLPYSAS